LRSGDDVGPKEAATGGPGELDLAVLIRDLADDLLESMHHPCLLADQVRDLRPNIVSQEWPGPGKEIEVALTLVEQDILTSTCPDQGRQVQAEQGRLAALSIKKALSSGLSDSVQRRQDSIRCRTLCPFGK
jgi:hypothetical protein